MELGRAAYDLVAANALAKGDVLGVAQLAGIMGAKHTATLIPLCHPLALSSVRVSLALVPEAAAVEVSATAACTGPTGVEMEALTAAAVAALTVYDMCKVGGWAAGGVFHCAWARGRGRGAWGRAAACLRAQLLAAALCVRPASPVQDLHSCLAPIACLQAVSKDITISGLRLLAKDGGKSGPYRRAGEPGVMEELERQQE